MVANDFLLLLAYAGVAWLTNHVYALWGSEGTACGSTYLRIWSDRLPTRPDQTSGSYINTDPLSRPRVIQISPFSNCPFPRWCN